MPHPERHYPARRALDDFGKRANLVFVTVCAKGHRSIIAQPDVHALLTELWGDSSQWLVGRYVLMPDHLHLFCAPGRIDVPNVRAWIAYWKSRSAAKWPRPMERPVWQREGWDRQVRRGESYAAKWEYVRNNPVRAGLVARAEDWPYQGELNSLPWHEA